MCSGASAFEGLGRWRGWRDFGFLWEGLDVLGLFLLPAGVFFDGEGLDLFGALGPEDLFGGIAVAFFGGRVMRGDRGGRRSVFCA